MAGGWETAARDGILCRMRIRQLVGAWFALLVLSALVPERLHAHGALKRARPAAGDTVRMVPRELRLEFNEAPELAVSSLRLLDPNGQDVALSPLRTVRDSVRILLADVSGLHMPGRYTVRWQIAGADGHPVRGEYHFVIAEAAAGLVPLIEPAAPPTVAPVAPATHAAEQIVHVSGFDAESVAYVLARWAQFVGLIVVIGAVAFHFLVLGSVRRDATMTALADDAGRRAAGLAAAAAVLVAVSSGARLVAQWMAVRGMANGAPTASLATMVTETTWGRAWIFQVAGICLLASALLAMRRTRSGWTLAAVAALVLVLSITLSSHAGATTSSWAMGLDAMHIVAAGGWMGGLSMLLLAGFPAARVTEGPPAGERMARLVKAFTPVALTFAAIVTFTGVAAAWRNLESLDALAGSRYGRVLVFKVIALLIAAGIGFYNWRRAQPRLSASGDDATIRRAMRAELATGIVILLITAVLVAIPTPADVVVTR
jgi:putative copper export protein/methionine-rich copper-binding protein CopC